MRAAAGREAAAALPRCTFRIADVAFDGRRLAAFSTFPATSQDSWRMSCAKYDWRAILEEPNFAPDSKALSLDTD